MLYTASDIIKRSLQLADIVNTDFLTHGEQTAYLNDAWTTVYQWLINKGDKQFVQEVELQDPQGFNEWVEYDIPKDLYQICSLKNKISGQIINRQAESQGINSGNYEIVNDKIRLYGVRTGPLLLTYWTKPVDISFPNKDVYTDLPFVYSPNGYILSRCGNTVLTRDGIIYNTLTSETLGNIEIDNTHSYLLGKGFYIDNSNIYNLKGESLGTIGSFPSNYFYDNDDNLWYEISSGIYQSGIGRPVKTLEFAPLSKYKDFYLVGNKIYKDDVEVYDLTGYVSALSQGMNIYTTNKGFYIALDTHALIVYLDEGDIDVSVVDNETNIVTKYGNLTTDYENFVVKSNIEDTLFDFPNEIYYSLLCTDLALRYCMKQNANTDGLNNLYENYRTTYMNTLSQDSGYERITNIYRR